MGIFNTVRDTASELFSSRRRLPAVIMLLFLALTLAALAGFIIYQFVQPDAAGEQPAEGEPLIVDEPMLLAPYTPFPDDYYVSRPPKEAWEEEEKNRWFTDPEGSLLDELSDSNNAAIQEILEAAP